MKTQPFSFPVDNDVIAVVLNDDTMNVKGIIVTVSKNGQTINATGYSNGIYSCADNSDIYCAYLKEINTVKISGKVQTGGFDTTGEIWFDFPVHDVNYTVTGIAIG